MATMFDQSIDVLSTSLNMYMIRHAIITDNIANAETPGYKARRVEFESELQRILDNKRAGLKQTITGSDITSLRPKVIEDATGEVGADRNTVDMDREMARLSKTDVQYSAATQAVSKKFALLKYAISGGMGR